MTPIYSHIGSLYATLGELLDFSSPLGELLWFGLLGK